MLHNHLRNFTSHELVVDLDAADQAHDGADGVDKFGAGVEIARHHIGGILDARQTVALRQRGGCRGENDGRRQKNLSLHHNSIIVL